MNGNSARVLLDLNHPGFQSEFFALEAPEIKKVFKALKKLKALTGNEVFQDHGPQWEELKSLPGKYTIRLSQSYRAVVMREGALLRFQTLQRDHDELRTAAFTLVFHARAQHPFLILRQ
ncbi:hypothetical protein C4901_09350 [Acidiferrobacter sp. SPIII_3]|uniref:hypothetical protein n=1 Tax=Acidiferrobacter sp. SPIII_3 TaxID=1281578 RepID=UPI000D72DCBE|nr:hypothetical protein [Acidiferrobacter sp. SPIII_3]AWP23508.1 hypothetical protein C4901_09350 [Acidiferrobacter sp. SPIII_3]